MPTETDIRIMRISDDMVPAVTTLPDCRCCERDLAFETLACDPARIIVNTINYMRYKIGSEDHVTQIRPGRYPDTLYIFCGVGVRLCCGKSIMTVEKELEDIREMVDDEHEDGGTTFAVTVAEIALKGLRLIAEFGEMPRRELARSTIEEIEAFRTKYNSA